MANAIRDFLCIKQRHMEPFEVFVKRLKTQAKKCQFSDPELMIKNQIINQCFQDNLKRRAAETEMTLDELISTGTKMGQIYTTHKAENQCRRCGCNQHVSNWSGCPALDTRCHNCSNRGHFTALCTFRRKRSCSKDALPNDQRKRHDVSCSKDALSTDQRKRHDVSCSKDALSTDQRRKRPDVSNSKDTYTKRPKSDWSENVSKVKYEHHSNGKMPMSDTDENGESSTVKGSVDENGSDKGSTSRAHVTTKKSVTIKLVGRSNGKSDERKEFDVEAIISDKYLVNVIGNELLEELKDKNFLDYFWGSSLPC